MYYRRRRILSIFAALLAVVICITSCSGKESIQIGVDPAFYPMQTGSYAGAFFAYTTELLQHISADAAIEITVVTLNWDNLLWGLNNQKCQAAVSSMEPNAYTQSQYNFSPYILKSGPVLVVAKNSNVRSIGDLEGVVLIDGSKEAEIVSKGYPNISVSNYQNLPEALNALRAGNIDGVIANQFVACPYVADLYQDALKIVGGPMKVEGLRIIYPKSTAIELQQKINESILRLEKEGILNQLQQKWGICF